MAKFMYSAQDADGNNTNGEITAKDKNDAIAKLRAQRMRPMSVKEKPAAGMFAGMGGSVKLDDLSRFTRQFAAMTSAGLPLVQCMDILGEQSEVPALSEALRQISMDIQGGNTLADSLRKHKKIFNDLYCNMVAAGEASGNLDGILVRLAVYQEKSAALQRKIKGAMMYPIILSVICVGATSILLIFVIPQFAAMFMEMGGELPMPTQMVMGVSDFLQKNIAYIIFSLIGISFGYKKVYSTPAGMLFFDGFYLKIPILGTMLQKSAVARFSSTLSTLLFSGLGILQALDITARTSGNKVIEGGLLGAIDKISGGSTIAEPLAETGMFPPMVSHMIAVGEKTGDISSMLDKISSFYEEEVDAAVEGLTAVMEPLMIVVMGGVIGSILIAMYLPMFNMTDMM